MEDELETTSRMNLSLSTFREKVYPYMDDMETMVSLLTTKIDDLKTESSSLLDRLKSAYTGDGLTTAETSFNSINTYCDSVKTTLEDGTKTVLDMSNDLIVKITELNTLGTEIDELEKRLTELGEVITIADDDEDHTAEIVHNRKISETEEEISTKKLNYNNKQDDALALLEKIKNYELDANKKDEKTTEDTSKKSLGDDFQGSLLTNLEGVTPGSYTKQTYTASNGKTITYWLYVPENIDTTTGLPVTLYMAGGGERGNMINSKSLPYYLNTGKTKPNGIVVCLQADNQNDYNTIDYLDASKELCDNVVTTYKADTNRISVSGHSVGGRGALSIAARYPNYFSVCVPVSGRRDKLENTTDSGTEAEALDNLTKTHIVGVTGTADMGLQYQMKLLCNTLTEKGGNMTVSNPQGYDHDAITVKYVEPIEIDGKVYDNLVEYLFSQTKA